MTVKKLALLGVASMATLGMSISMAGGPATCAPAAEVSGVYVGVNVGGNYDTTLDYNRGAVSTAALQQIGHTRFTSVTSNTTNHVPWAWTVDALIGYQFNNNWALQFGYIWNQEQKDTAVAEGNRGGTTFGPETVTMKAQVYSLYLGLRGMLPLWDDFGAYMMVGPAWNHIKLKASFSGTTSLNGSESTSYWSPIAAVGVSWHVADGMSVNLQYMYNMGDFGSKDANSLDGDARGSQRVTIGLGYLFAM